MGNIHNLTIDVVMILFIAVVLGIVLLLASAPVVRRFPFWLVILFGAVAGMGIEFFLWVMNNVGF